MKKPLMCVVGGSEVAIVCALALATACTGSIGSIQGNSGQAGGSPAGVGGTGTPGTGSSTGAGGSASGSAGTGATGTGATGGAAGMADVGTIYPNPPAFAPAPGLLRRLTRNQFRNAVRDVFAYDVNVGDLDTDSFTANFASIGAATVVTSDRGVEQYSTAIENAVNAVFADSTKRSQFIGCTPTGQSNDTCVRGFIQKLGLRAWRRPLESTELDRFVALAASASTTLASATEGARWATVALFTSPSFLYRPEIGAASTSGALRLSGYEIASRLSFLIWNSLPDQTLMDQATSGMLGTADGIRTAATRMLNASAGRESVGGFAEEYMRLDRIGTQAKDPALFPEYATNLQAAMVRDIRDTWASLAFDDQASFYDLFTTTKVVVNADLARLYGIDATGLTSTTFQTKSLPAGGTRSGVLSKAGLLSEFANQQSGSPTLRGKFIRESLMCLTIPPPPPGVNTAVVDQPTNVPMTRRQKLEVHMTNDSCAACHKFMDPLGFPLENFDAIGKYRTTDNGLPVDPTGSFDGVAVADANGLGVAASQSVTVAQCLVRKYYGYAVGHEERDVDGSVLNTLATAFKASGFKMRDLILAAATNDAFSVVAPQP
jgi:Protein of unknown function (DUF1592)/Protein of unknown function (DUF1588)/Protein of unknown function (DUF1595)/Protein of unknown function (DUF1585)/Protein of unknown function (DUF1587)